MKNCNLAFHFLPKDFTILGITYETGEGQNIKTEEVFPLYRISIGILLLVIELTIMKKGEN